MKQGMTIRSAGRRQRLLEWSQRVAGCRQSGMSVKRWCEENEITTKTYYTWQKKVFTAMVEQQRIQLEAVPAEEPCFVELPTQQLQQPSGGLVAHIQIGGASVDLYPGIDMEMIQIIAHL
ncbi:MAG: hypothetical protein Q4D31_00750 [Eubacteriales bacterium]|nr:hypothetical protein [Eubacteriales bacterium]